MDFFYHNSIKTYTISLLDMFSHIQIPRYNSDGEKISDFKVPIVFGSKDKAYSLSKHDIENLHSGNVNAFPRLVLSFLSMNKAQDRNTGKMNRINKIQKNEDSLLYTYHLNGVAYDFDFVIYIATRTFTDATIIIEQIAPMFNPDITLKIRELDIQNEPTSVPVALGEFSITLPEDLDETEIRIIEAELNVTVKGTLYPPIKDSNVISKLEVNTIIVTDERDEKEEIYEVDLQYPTEVADLASIITAESEESAPAISKVNEARINAVVDVEHFD